MSSYSWCFNTVIPSQSSQQKRYLTAWYQFSTYPYSCFFTKLNKDQVLFEHFEWHNLKIKYVKLICKIGPTLVADLANVSVHQLNQFVEHWFYVISSPKRASSSLLNIFSVYLIYMTYHTESAITFASKACWQISWYIV